MIIFCQEPIYNVSYASKLSRLLPFINSIITTNSSDFLLSEPTASKHEKGQTPILNFLKTIKNYLLSNADSRTDEGYTSKNLQQVIRCVEDYKNNLNPMINLDRSSNDMKEMKKKKQFLRSRYKMILQKEENDERKQNKRICEQEIIYSKYKQNYQTKKKERFNFGNSIKTAKIKQYMKSRKEVQQECIDVVDLASKPFLQKQRGTIWRNISKEKSIIGQETEGANNRIDVNQYQQAVENKQQKQYQNQRALINKQKDPSENDRQKRQALLSNSESSPISSLNEQQKVAKEQYKKTKNDDNQIKSQNNPFLSKTSGKLNLSAIISGHFSLPSSNDVNSVASNSHVQPTLIQNRQQQIHQEELQQQQQQLKQQRQPKLSFNPSSISNGQIAQSMGTYPPFMHQHQNQTSYNSLAPQMPLQMGHQQHVVHNFGPAYGTNNEEFNRNAIAMFFGHNNKQESEGLFNGIEKTNKKPKVSKKPKIQPRIS